MRSTFESGVFGVRAFPVDVGRTIDFMGEEARVYATSSLIRDIERICRELIVEHAGPGEDSVGTKVSISHTAPTLFGIKGRITATDTDVDRKSVVFDISANDALDTICSGRHERFVVDVENTKQRLKAKAAAVAEIT